MSRPGYVYFIGRSNEYGDWVKVGVAARIGRVYDHRGWDMLERTFESDQVIADAYGLELSILSKFPDSNSSSTKCSICGAPKPPIGRSGIDGTTEIRHLKCYPGIYETFVKEWKQALRLSRKDAWLVDFDPLTLRPGGFEPVGDPWRQPPRMDSNEYQANTCNVLCVRGVPAEEVITFLDQEWEKGTPDLRKALWNKYGEHVCKRDGTPSPNAKGSGGPDVVLNLTGMTKFRNVQILLLSVRKPGTLYAYARPGTLGSNPNDQSIYRK